MAHGLLQSSRIQGQRGCLSINAVTDGALDQDDFPPRASREYNRRLEGLLRAAFEPIAPIQEEL